MLIGSISLTTRQLLLHSRRCAHFSATRFGSEKSKHDAYEIQDYKRLKLVLMSRRLDQVINKSTKSSTSVTEKALAAGNVRVNERIVKKKSHNVEEEDEIEIWTSEYEDNYKLAVVKRLQIESLTISADGYAFVIKYWRNFIVNNWKKQDE